MTAAAAAKPSYTPADRLTYRAEAAGQIADRLEQAGLRLGNRFVMGRAFLMRQCAELGNAWLGKDLEKVTGGSLESPDGQDVELFYAYGTLFGCNCRACPSCANKLRKRSRQKAEAALNAHRLGTGREYRFITLTMRKLEGCTLEESIKIFQNGWRRLQKHDFWRARVYGGIKGVEFTRNDDGYHVHAHFLVDSRWIEIQRTCINPACGSTQVEKHLPRPAVADCPALPGGFAGETITTFHCLKCAWHWPQSKQPANNLIDVWEKIISRAQGKSYQDTASISVRLVRAYDAKHTHQADGRMSQKKALFEVLKYIAKSSDWLKLPDQELAALASIRRWPRMFEVFGSLAESLHKSQSTNSEKANLDTENLSAADQKTEPEPAPKPKRRVSESLLSLLDRLSLAEFKKIALARIKRIKDFRMRQLASLYPTAVFSILRDYAVYKRRFLSWFVEADFARGYT